MKNKEYPQPLESKDDEFNYAYAISGLNFPEDQMEPVLRTELDTLVKEIITAVSLIQTEEPNSLDEKIKKSVEGQESLD